MGKRSGSSDHLNSMSPYHSSEDLTAIDVHDDGSVSLVDDLSSKAAGPRVAARNTIIRHLEKYAVDAAIEGSLMDIHQCCLKTLSHPRSSKLELLGSIQLAVLLLVAHGDSHHEVCDAVARTLYFVVASAVAGTADDAVLASALAGLTLVHALHPSILVDDGLSTWNGLRRLQAAGPAAKAPELYPLTRAQYLLARAAVAPLSSQDDDFVELVHSSLDDASYEVVAAAVEAIGVYAEGHAGSFTRDVVSHLRRVSSKEAGAETKRNLLQAVRTLEAYLSDSEEGVAPTETVHFRARDATISGFKRVLLLQTLRSFVRDGLQAHFAHNVAVRRLFNLTADLTSKLSKEEKEEEEESRRQAKEVKEEALKDRSLARRQKQAARSLDEGDE
jgi:hypothetical protein